MYMYYIISFIPSGLFPLFKPGSADMGGACLRAHISMKLTAENKSTRIIEVRTY